MGALIRTGMMRWVFSNVAGGIVRWGTAVIISAVCLVYGFAPDAWLAIVISAPPAIVSSPWLKLAAVLVGISIFGGMVWWEIRRSMRSDSVGGYRPAVTSAKPLVPSKSLPDASSDPFINIEEAGRWLYDNGNQQTRESLRENVGPNSVFKSIGDHGALIFYTAAEDRVCQLYAKREAQLSFEPVSVGELQQTPFESVFGSERPILISPSIKRSQLKKVLEWYQADAKEHRPQAHRRTMLLSTARAFRDEIVLGRLVAATNRLARGDAAMMLDLMSRERVHSPELMAADKTALTKNQTDMLSRYQYRERELSMCVDDIVQRKSEYISNPESPAKDFKNRLNSLATALERLILSLDSDEASDVPEPEPEFISLRDAAARLYGQLRGSEIAKRIEERSGTGDGIILNFFGEILARQIPLNVRKSPSPYWEDFDRKRLNEMKIWDGATSICRVGGEQRVYFSEIRLRRAAFEAALLSVVSFAESQDDALVMALGPQVA